MVKNIEWESIYSSAVTIAHPDFALLIVTECIYIEAKTCDSQQPRVIHLFEAV